MSARPLDWSPLAEKDPIGGDATAVQSEASYYSNLAQEINDQVTRLRSIAAHDEMLGKTADKLRSAAGETADKLAKTHGRVGAVGSALTTWVPHLLTAQADTLSALHAAQDAAATQAQNAPPAPGSPPPKTDADKHNASVQQKNLTGANDALSAARTKFHNAVSERDNQAGKIANQIKDSLHDGLKDGFWDHISHWVTQHVELIKMIVEVLSWVATALSIASIFFPFLLPFAMVATGLTMLGHTLLAATGNGSWLDVGLDAFALATMGAGSMLTNLAKGSRLAAVAEAADVEGGAARAAVASTRAGEKTVLEAATSNVFKRFLTVKGWQAASALRGFDATTATLAEGADATARASALARTLPEVRASATLRAGGLEMAENVGDLRALHAGYPDSSAISALARTGGGLLNANAATAGVAGVTDLANHALSHSSLPLLDRLPYSQGWENFKEMSTTGGAE